MIRIGNMFTKKLANKLVVLFSTIMILTIFSLTFLSCRIIENESVNNIINSNQNTLALVNENIENYFEEINQASLPQLKYDKLMNALLEVSDEISSEAYLEDYIRGLFYSHNDFEAIDLYIVDQQSCYYISRGDGMDVKVRKIDNSNVANSNWYKKTLTSNSNTYVQPLSDQVEIEYKVDASKCFFAFHRAIRNIVDTKPYAILTFYCNYKGIDKIRKNVALKDGEKLALFDEDNNLFYASCNEDTKYLQDSKFTKNISDKNIKMFDYEFTNKKYLTIYDFSPNKKFKLVKSIPYDAIYKTANENSYLSITVGCIILILSMIFVVLSSNAITNPIKKLTQKMHRFSEGEFDIKAKVKGNDEIADLTMQFNQMVTKINDLINEKYRIELEEKNAKLKALEAELNPHFLYNALQAISTSALKIGAEDISEMVNALAETFRYSINGKNLVTIADEINYVNYYLIIQNARFGPRLKVIYNIDNEALKALIPKLSIQLLIENAIKHVLEKEYISLIINVNIKVMDNEQISISVKDNGCGIPPDMVEEICRNIENVSTINQSIGLKNLNTRLRLLYKEKAGITINSNNTGTEISFIIPNGEKANV